MSKARGATFLAIVVSVISFSGAVSAKNYIIWVGGDCSTQWINKAEVLYANQFRDVKVLGTYINQFGSAQLNPAPICGYPTSTSVANCPAEGWINHDSVIDNTSDPWASMGQLANVLNSHCRIGSGSPAHYETRIHPKGSCKTTTCFAKLGCACTAFYTVDTPYSLWVPAVPEDTCVIVNHSGSDNVVRLLLATYDDFWNIRAVYTSAGAGGGSEVASAMVLEGSVDAGTLLSDTDSPASCGFRWWMDVDTARSGYGLGRWAWDDTNAKPIYHASAAFTAPGDRYSTWVDDFFPGMNDHGVAYHSDLGRADVGPYMLVTDEGPNGNYFGHYLIGSPDGPFYGSAYFDRTTPPGPHFQAKRVFLSYQAYFVDAATTCDAFTDKPTEECQAGLPDNGPSWYDQFLNGLVGDGYCYVGCSGHDYSPGVYP
jgi:hypothetical protein